MEGQEISMKSENTIWHITFEDLMKNAKLGAQMTFYAENDVTFDFLFLLDLALEKKSDMKKSSDSFWNRHHRFYVNLC